MSKINNGLELVYTLLCDDVRLEVGNKLSFMGVFQNIIVHQLPISLIKMAIVNHWRGDGSYLSEVRILSPNRQHPVVLSQPSRFELSRGGFADNISFFVNVIFSEPGNYWVQTLIDSNLFDEQPLLVVEQNSMQSEDMPDIIN
jgi:hypothetical protein